MEPACGFFVRRVAAQSLQAQSIKGSNTSADMSTTTRNAAVSAKASRANPADWTWH
jgi:hypothetical protein